MADSTRYDAFISYRKDNGFLMAQVIHDRLIDRGLSCFLDQEELKSGKFDEKILVAIQEAHSFILILSKNALTRCKYKNDWVRREVLEAIRCRKTIIPVICDDFKWPQQWSRFTPEEIRSLEKMNGVSGSKEYMSAMIDKIISYMPQDAIREKTLTDNTEPDILPTKTAQFFEKSLKILSDVRYVDMAFHGGMDWRLSSQKIKILTYLIKNNIKLRILANTDEVAKRVTQSMSQPLKKYASYAECLHDWYELSQKYPENISVKTPEVPLLHRIYIIRGKDVGTANIKYYTYGNYIPDNDFRMTFRSGTREYKLYTEEFDYLWNHSHDYVPESHNT